MSKEQAEAEKALAEAAKLNAEAEKIRQENAEWAREDASRRREAERRAEIAKFDKEELESQKAQFASFVPDLSTVKVGETKVVGDQPAFGSALALGALDDVAAAIARDVKSVAGDNYAVLVTDDSNLVVSDAAYIEVSEGLDELDAAATALLSDSEPQLKARFLVPAAAGAVAAVAQAVPSVLSLLSANRSVSSSPIAADDLTASMSVAAALAQADPGATVFLDGFRPLKPGPLTAALDRVRERRRALIERRIELVRSPGDPAAVMRAEMIASLVGAVDAYLTMILATPADASHSIFTTALLREALHRGTDGPRWVLLVKGQSGSAQQLVNDRPLWWQDKFSTVATVGISYLLVNVATGQVKKGGARSASRALSGTIGSEFTVTNVRPI